MTSEKIVVICEVNCPMCNKRIHILKKVNVIRPAKPAEKEEIYYAEKVAQKTLDEVKP